MKRTIAVLLVLALSAWVSASLAPPPQQAFQKSHRMRAEAMSAAATRWLDALPDDLEPRARLLFDDESRLEWGYVPRERPGVALGELGPKERRLLDALLQQALSQQGYLKAHGVIELEEVIDRDPGLYHVAIYGDPSPEGPWAWRLEGHHLSLSFTVRDGRVTATPLFVGAQPAVVAGGPHGGLELFYEEEALARELARSLTEEQREQGLRADADPPDDVVLDPSRTTDLDPIEGVANATMTPQQTQLLMRLLGLHTGVLHADLGLAALNRYRMDDIRTIRFLWIGSLEPGAPLYYRIHGPSLDYVVEYVNRGDHVHCSWRDLREDFGGALAASEGDAGR